MKPRHPSLTRRRWGAGRGGPENVRKRRPSLLCLEGLGPGRIIWLLPAYISRHVLLIAGAAIRRMGTRAAAATGAECWPAPFSFEARLFFYRISKVTSTVEKVFDVPFHSSDNSAPTRELSCTTVGLEKGDGRIKDKVSAAVQSDALAGRLGLGSVDLWMDPCLRSSHEQETPARAPVVGREPQRWPQRCK